MGEITGVCPLEASEASAVNVWLGHVAVIILHSSVGVTSAAAICCMEVIMIA